MTIIGSKSMSEQLKIKCCNKPVSIERNAEQEGKKGVGVWCESCGLNSFHEDEKTAISMIEDAIKNKPTQEELELIPPKEQKRQSRKENKRPMKTNSTALIIKPRNAGELESYFHDHQKHMIEITSPVVGDMKAMERLISNNMRYVQNAKQLKDIWTTEEGQESIIHETEEAMMMGAELGKMGDLVPFKPVCQFIPSVEAYEFALTNGNNAPFQDITIEPIYEGDKFMNGRKSGDFFLDFESFGDRLEVIKVAVYGFERKSSHIIGEVYAADRLLEKASEHSQPYRNYLKMMKAFEYAKSEGKTSTDENGRESFIYFVIKETEDKYFQQSVDNFKAAERDGKLKTDGKGEYAVQVLPKKDGGTWEKKTYRYEVEGGKEQKTIYIDDLTNPYAGPDQPEMLRKAAGKSFLRKYQKVRNSEAALSEVRSHKQTVNKAFDMSDEILGGGIRG